jgi:hypothetical protein
MYFFIGSEFSDRVSRMSSSQNHNGDFREWYLDRLIDRSEAFSMRSTTADSSCDEKRRRILAEKKVFA